MNTAFLLSLRYENITRGLGSLNDDSSITAPIGVYTNKTMDEVYEIGGRIAQQIKKEGKVKWVDVLVTPIALNPTYI